MNLIMKLHVPVTSLACVPLYHQSRLVNSTQGLSIIHNFSAWHPIYRKTVRDSKIMH